MRSLSFSSLRTRGPIPSVFLLSLVFVTSFASPTFEYRESKCNNASAYSDDSTYSSNLLTVLNYLVQNGSQSGFNTTSYGQSPNKVYGLIQCIGNISAQDCSKCLQLAKTPLTVSCASNIGGQVWMSYCYLRYDNSSFFSKLDTDGKYLWNFKKVTNESADDFRSVTFKLLSNLSKIASKPATASKGFAIGSAAYSPLNRVNCLVQCWRDITLNDCNTCLTSAIKELDSCCSTRQGGQALLGSCTVRYEIYSFYDPSSPSTPPNSPTAADAPANEKSSKVLPIILGTLGGVILVIVTCLFALRRKLKSLIFGEPVTSHTERQGYSVETGLLLEENIFLFSLQTLIEASQNFDPVNKLGEGGFGTVYKGTTKDGRDIAVKKLSATSSQGKTQFMNEVKLVANIQHRNLVKLLGCCLEGDERLLVYEYLPNKSLDNFLFDPKKREHLDWEKRYNIIIGVARGLLYLHEDSQPRIIHRDVKASNILLDDKLNPKIADFGLARLFSEDETHIQTRVAGTYGYMAPEYAMRGQLSVKADVYSFGVLLLEIVSGRKNTENYLSQESQNLLEWVWGLYKRGDVLNMVDSMVIKDYPEEQVQRCIDVGLLCVQANANLRPTISLVLKMISGNSVILPNPTKPAFVSSYSNSCCQVAAEEKASRDSTSGTATITSDFSSVNETSGSDLKAR